MCDDEKIVILPVIKSTKHANISVSLRNTFRPPLVRILEIT